MSFATRLRNRVSSLSFRAGAVSAVCTYSTIFIVASLSYFSVKNEFLKRDRELIFDQLAVIESLLSEAPQDPQRLVRRIEVEWPNRTSLRTFVRVLAPDAKVITESPAGDFAYQDLFKNTEINGKSSFDSFSMHRMKKNDDVFVIAAIKYSPPKSDGKEYLIQIAIQRNFEESLLQILKRSILYFSLIGLLATLISGIAFARMATKPIGDLSEFAKNINLDELKSRVEPKLFPIEFQEIVKGINGMLERLQSSFNRLDQFSEDMAHELRSPLNNLLLSMQVILNKARAPGEYEEFIKSNIEDCLRLKRIIDSLLFIARTKNPNLDLKKEKFEANKQLEQIVSFYQISAQEKSIEIEFIPNSETWINAEKTLFQRAIGNLLSNAILYSPQNTKVSVTLKREFKYLQILIQDKGHGLAADKIDKIGERFFTNESSRSKDYSGNGLGLSIVKSIVELHKGTLSVQSEVGSGSTFSISLPLDN